jgi:hypothetical protein
VKVTAHLHLFFNFENFAAFVVPAIRASPVGEAHLTAVGALHHIAGFQRIMGAALVAAGPRLFLLWQWGHDLLLLFFY